MQSFVPVAPDSHFPLQNLPYGIFSFQGDAPRTGVAIGDFVLDLALLEAEGVLATTFFARPTLNQFMAAGRPVWDETRDQIQTLLSIDTPRLRDDAHLRARALISRADVTLHLPAAIGDYTDFYSSMEHARNVGTMFRGAENALLPNWVHLPVAYHGRASSIILSGTPVVRPWGQRRVAEEEAPVFAPTKKLDFELELGFFVGTGNRQFEPIPIEEALDHVFGFVLVNDWSARDIQAWEYRPLGPFNAKNFATSISPWVVPTAALMPFRTPAPVLERSLPEYLQILDRRSFAITLEVMLKSEKMPEAQAICRSNTKHLYWSVEQQLAHHSSGGCNLRPGDLLASGTISGPTPDEYGSLLELTQDGLRPLSLHGGETRRFLEDGDTVTLTGFCQGDGYRIGFGRLEATVKPARQRRNTNEIGRERHLSAATNHQKVE